jgi:hypothetical protein
VSETSHVASGAVCEPIDAVYTWVDGGDPEFREQLSQYRGKQAVDKHSSYSARFRDNQELRFSLRSLERYAPWVGRVYLVTNGQVPDWIDTNHSRLILVDHKALFASPALLPSFNSFAIEWQLFRIPGLSRRFLYFNDDFFLGRAVLAEDFLTPSGGQRVHVEPFNISSNANTGHATDRALAFTASLLDGRFTARPSRQKIAHVPYLLDKSVLSELDCIWSEQIRRTASHRFRHPNDLAIQTLYFYYLLESPEQLAIHEQIDVSIKPGTHVRVELGPPARRVLRRLSGIARRRPKFFCLNDEMEISRPGDWLISKSVRIFLECYFRRPSSFEKL